MTDRRIGVFICHCGGNISDYLDVEEVRKAIEHDPGVVVAKRHMFTCSDASQQEIIDDIKTEKLDGLVIASCSPKLHLYTFREMAKRAGLNPYQYTQVNLREQDSWTHRTEWESATEKGVRMVRAGIARARDLIALEPLRIETIPKVLIIGGGISGLRGALGLSDLGLNVYLIEKENTLGGWAVKWGTMFPNNKVGSEIVESLVRKLKERENVTIFTQAELIEKGGNVGDFDIKIRTSTNEIISEKVGAIIVATGFEPYTPVEGEFGFGSPGVLTLADFKERLAGTDGPLTYNGKEVRSIVYIHCVGSREQESEKENPNLYCSRFCCTAVLHEDIEVAGKNPGLRQYHIYRDIRTYGKYELIYEEARQKGAIFIGYDPTNPPEVTYTKQGLEVKVTDILTQSEELEIPTDLVVLVTGLIPRMNDDMVNILKLPVGIDGFFNEVHPKLRPVETLIDGVFIAGTAQGPKTLEESVGSALASVSKAAALLLKGYLDLEPLIARVDEEKCVWCGACLEACPYGAIDRITCDGKELAHVIPALCKGGGPCVPVCPNDAIDVEGYTDTQVRNMIDALLQEV